MKEQTAKGITEEESNGLTRGVGLFASIAIIVGSMIGSGIFRKAAPMASLLGSEWLVLLVWLGAGIITLFGALTLAEITAMMPTTGGQYRYYRLMYGDAFAFVSGWSIFSVIQSGSIASIAYVFSDYLNSMTPLLQLDPQIVNQWSCTLPGLGVLRPFENLGVKLVSCALIVGLTSLNVRGVKSGAGVASVLSTIKVLSLVAIVIICASMGSQTQNSAQISHISTPTGLALLSALPLALSKAFWAYDGWGSIGYIGGEIRDPQRTLPRALLVGVSLVIVLYMAINFSYMSVLSMDEIAHSNLVAADVMTRVLGPSGAALIAIAVMISTLGATNGTILNSARVYFAMAQDGLFFSSMAKVHERYRTPAVSLRVQAVWSCILVMSGSFETLTDMLIFVSWIYYAMTAYGVFVLRRSMPDQPRPYKVWAYPFVPIIFIAVAAAFVVLTIRGEWELFQADSSRGLPSLNGLAICLSGLPVYWWFKRRQSH